ncbi:MAG: RsmD family RNA methyltransferase [Kiloniellales bacterium]|nr:RsmD family RNA methyltransferase [Kiloniellales bacterium]
MRIVAGRHRGRTLIAPEGLAVRPTADRTREAIFNVLTHGKLVGGKLVGGKLAGGKLAGGADPLAEARVLDAFAGTGALGLEALSRGAARVTFMESQAAALAALRANLEALGEGENAEVLAVDVLRPPPAPAPCGIVLMDPPYNQGLAAPALAALAAAGWIAPGATVAVELMKAETFEAPAGFELRDARDYGKAKVAFLARSG